MCHSKIYIKHYSFDQIFFILINLNESGNFGHIRKLIRIKKNVLQKKDEIICTIYHHGLLLQCL